MYRLMSHEFKNTCAEKPIESIQGKWLYHRETVDRLYSIAISRLDKIYKPLKTIRFNFKAQTLLIRCSLQS